MRQLQESAWRGCSLCYKFTECGFLDWTFSEVLSRHEDCQASSFGFVIVGVRTLEVNELSPSFYVCLPTNDPEHDGPKLPEWHCRGYCVRFRVTLAALGTLDESFEVAVPKLPNNLPLSGTKEALPLAQRWLEACEGTHAQCQVQLANFTPTRLVSTTASAARVCHAASIPVSSRYTTLSHCWGRGSFTTLSKANIDNFETRIPDDALSQTVKDAIEISRSLGFAYIWIDTRYKPSLMVLVVLRGPKCLLDDARRHVAV
jgi:hypothetical protein